MDQTHEQIEQGESLDAIARRERSLLGTIGWWTWRALLIGFVLFIGYVGWANEKPARLPGEILADAESSDNEPTSTPPPSSVSAFPRLLNSSFDWNSRAVPEPSLITVTPVAAPKASLVKIGAWEEQAKPLPAAAIQLQDVPELHSIGELLVVVATVVGEEGVPLADQIVEWSLDRQGIGDLLAAGGADDPAQAVNRLTPFFARSHTARNGYRLDEKLSLPQPLEIQPGQAWCIITGRSPGDMVLSASCPGIASIQKRQVDARVHWHDASAKFPGSLVARAGGTVKLPVVVANSKGEPQAGYRTRFELLAPGGAEFAGADSVAEVHSNTAGTALATLKQDKPKAGASKVKIQLFGGQAFPGKAIALAEAVVDVEWQESPVLVQIQMPASVTTGTWTPVSLHARVEGSNLPEDAQVIAIFDPGLDVSLTAPGSSAHTSLYQPPILITPPEKSEEKSNPPAPVLTPPSKPKVEDAPGEVSPPPAVKLEMKTEKPDDKPELPPPSLEVRPAPTPSVPKQKLDIPQSPADSSPPERPAKIDDASNADVIHFTDKHHVVLGTLASKEGITATLGIRAAEPARRWVRIEVRQGDNVLASKQAAIEFVAPSLLVQKDAPSRWRVEQPGRYTITVTNPGSFAVENVQVRDELMPGLRVEKADALRFSDHLLWQVDRLDPGEKRQFEVLARPTQLIEGLALRTWATATGVQTAECYSEATVTGLAGVSLSIHDLADPVQIDQEVEYLIEVENRGNGPAYHVRFDVQTPKNLKLLTVTGSLAADIVDQELRLQPLEELGVGSRLYARLRAKCVAKGEARISISLRHDASGDLGIVSQESTNIYQLRDFPPPVQFSGDLPLIQE